jgi:hypothetical protein
MIASGTEMIEDAMGGAMVEILEEAGGLDVVGVHLRQGVSGEVVGAVPTVEVEEVLLVAYLPV